MHRGQAGAREARREPGERERGGAAERGGDQGADEGREREGAGHCVHQLFSFFFFKFGFSNNHSDVIHFYM